MPAVFTILLLLFLAGLLNECKVNETKEEVQSLKTQVEQLKKEQAAQKKDK